jgi:hypothetical protein
LIPKKRKHFMPAYSSPKVWHGNSFAKMLPLFVLYILYSFGNQPVAIPISYGENESIKFQ